jgi:hypothetical protein
LATPFSGDAKNVRLTLAFFFALSSGGNDNVQGGLFHGVKWWTWCWGERKTFHGHGV